MERCKLRDRTLLITALLINLVLQIADRSVYRCFYKPHNIECGFDLLKIAALEFQAKNFASFALNVFNASIIKSEIDEEHAKFVLNKKEEIDEFDEFIGDHPHADWILFMNDLENSDFEFASQQLKKNEIPIQKYSYFSNQTERRNNNAEPNHK